MASRLVQANFARVSYTMKDQRLFIMADVKKITSSEMLSQLGGSLNLWSGLTVVVILEMAEMFFRLVSRLLRKCTYTVGAQVTASEA